MYIINKVDVYLNIVPFSCLTVGQNNTMLEKVIRMDRYTHVHTHTNYCNARLYMHVVNKYSLPVLL